MNPIGVLELIGGVATRTVADVAGDGRDEEEHDDHRRGQVDPCRPGTEFDEDRDQQGRERVEQRRPVRDVDLWMRAMIVGGHDLPVLPDPEDQGEEKNQPCRQQGDLGIDSERVGHRPDEFSCAS